MLLLDALRCKNKSSRIPVWLMRQAGRYQPSYQSLRQRYSFSEMCLTPELACQVTLLPVLEFDVDAAILFSDILFPLIALDLDVRFSSSSAPSVHAQPLNTDTLEGRVKTVLESQFSSSKLLSACGSIYAAAGLVRKELKGEKPLLGFSAAPWTLITYILEGKTSPSALLSRSFMRGKSEASRKLLEIVEHLIALHLNYQIDAGCQALQIFDSWSSELDDESFKEFALTPLKRIVSMLKNNRPESSCPPIIYFTKGMAYRYSALAQSGIHALSCDMSLSPMAVKEWALAHTLALQGNLDPALLCLPKEHPELKNSLKNLLGAMKGSHNYIFNLGHGVPKEANYETVRYVIQSVKESLS